LEKKKRASERASDCFSFSSIQKSDLLLFFDLDLLLFSLSLSLKDSLFKTQKKNKLAFLHSFPLRSLQSPSPASWEARLKTELRMRQPRRPWRPRRRCGWPPPSFPPLHLAPPLLPPFFPVLVPFPTSCKTAALRCREPCPRCLASFSVKENKGGAKEEQEAEEAEERGRDD